MVRARWGRGFSPARFVAARLLALDLQRAFGDSVLSGNNAFLTGLGHTRRWFSRDVVAGLTVLRLELTRIVVVSKGAR